MCENISWHLNLKISKMSFYFLAHTRSLTTLYIAWRTLIITSFCALLKRHIHLFNFWRIVVGEGEVSSPLERMDTVAQNHTQIVCTRQCPVTMRAFPKRIFCPHPLIHKCWKSENSDGKGSETDTTMYFYLCRSK